MSSLSNPKAVWFLGAPVSKAIAITAVVTYIVAEMNKIHNALIFGKCNKISSISQYYHSAGDTFDNPGMDGSLCFFDSNALSDQTTEN